MLAFVTCFFIRSDGPGVVDINSPARAALTYFLCDTATSQTFANASRTILDIVIGSC